MTCSVARDVQRCMANFMQFGEEDILEIPLLEPVDDVPVASLTPAEETALLDEPQEAQVTTMCLLTCDEKAPKPESAAQLEETAKEPPDM